MFLVDTNIFLEVLLGQERAEEAETFLLEIPGEFLYISDFSLYSIGIILSKVKRADVYPAFVEDIILRAGMRLSRLTIFDFRELVEVMERFNLDFDDAYQYTLAKKHNLRIVSFDSDFEKTDLGKISPKEALVLFKGWSGR